MPKDLPERTMIVEAYADSLKIVWAVMAGLAFVALLFSTITERLKLNEQQVTEQGLSDSKSKSRAEDPGNTDVKAMHRVENPA